MMRNALAFAIAIGMTLPASADTLDLVRSKLEAMPATTPLSGTLDFRVVGRTEDRPAEDGRTRAHVTADASGLSIRHPLAALEDAKTEALDPNPDRNRPAIRALRSIEASEVAEIVDYAPYLLSDLTGAKITNESVTRLSGREVRLLEIELPVRLSAEARKRIRSSEASMKLWIGPDNVPIASEQSSTARGRFLLISFQGTRQESRTFTRSGNRLVVTRLETHTEGSGLGKSAGESRWATLQLD